MTSKRKLLEYISDLERGDLRDNASIGGIHLEEFNNDTRRKAKALRALVHEARPVVRKLVPLDEVGTDVGVWPFHNGYEHKRDAFT